MNKKCIILFTKTPYANLAKSRLAKDIGNNLANYFFYFSVNKTLEKLNKIIEKNGSIDLIIAPYDSNKVEFWKNYQIRLQEEEKDFGDRLLGVFNQAFNKYNQVLVLGSDSPQINEEHIKMAFALNSMENSIVFGPGLDGGFYLMCSNKVLPNSFFNGIEFSSSKTLKQILKLNSSLNILLLDQIENDLDIYDDLIYYLDKNIIFY